MGYQYNKLKPYIRSLTHTVHKGEKIISLSLQGKIWEDNGFSLDDLVIIKPVGNCKLLIEKLNLPPKENTENLQKIPNIERTD